MINSINANIATTNISNRELRDNKQNENNKVSESGSIQLSKAEQIKEQIKNGEYKIDLQQTSKKMASDLLNL